MKLTGHRLTRAARAMRGFRLVPVARGASGARPRLVAVLAVASLVLAAEPVAGPAPAAPSGPVTRVVAAPRVPPGAAGRVAPAPPRPNVVVVMTDDQDVASMAVMRNVRRLLAEQGTTFANSFVSFSWCCPSRATFLTGRYPHNHGVMGNKPPDGGYARMRAQEEESLPVWLGRAGYATAHIGKYLNGYGADDAKHVPAGWQEWYGSVDPSTYRMWDYTLNENGRLKRYGSSPDDEDPDNYQTDVYARKAVDYIRRRAPSEQPFFLSMAPLAPHAEGVVARRALGVVSGTPRPAPRHEDAFADRPLPFTPSFDEADVGDKPPHIQAIPRMGPITATQVTENYRARLASLLAVDDAVADIVEALDSAGELANTVIVFTSDNGWLQGEHRIPCCKIHPYEESIKVPLILRGPGVARHATSPAPVTNADLAPTLLDIAGARAGRTVDGRSLRRLAAAGAAPAAPRDLLVETGPKRSAEPWYAAIRAPGYLYVEHSTGDKELYDLAADPYELTSRAGQRAYAAREKDLARRLRALRGCAGATCP